MRAKKSNGFVISFRVSDEEREALYAQAKKCGVTISQLLRRQLDLQNNEMQGN